ncbi:keywimysin-related RiPP [Nocardia sp. NPDC051570]
MRETYERPTLRAIGSFVEKTGALVAGAHDGVLVLRLDAQ